MHCENRLGFMYPKIKVTALNCYLSVITLTFMSGLSLLLANFESTVNEPEGHENFPNNKKRKRKLSAYIMK